MVDECKDTSIHGLFGWNAMPLALDDFDSNFVSILGEEAILAQRRGVCAQMQVKDDSKQLYVHVCVQSTVMPPVATTSCALLARSQLTLLRKGHTNEAEDMWAVSPIWCQEG